MGRDSGWSRAPWDGKFLWEFLEDRGTISGSTCIAARGTSPPRESVHLWWRGVAATARPWGAFWAVAPLSGAIWPICGICGQWLLPAGGGQPHRRLQGCQRRPSLGCSPTCGRHGTTLGRVWGCRAAEWSHMRHMRPVVAVSAPWAAPQAAARLPEASKSGLLLAPLFPPCSRAALLARAARAWRLVFTRRGAARAAPWPGAGAPACAGGGRAWRTLRRAESAPR